VPQVNSFFSDFFLNFCTFRTSPTYNYPPPPLFDKYIFLFWNDKIAVETGPPVARHRERNSFKFFGVDEGKPSNELLVTSPKLSSLYNSTATFRVKFDDNEQGDLIAKFQISRRLHVNETKCEQQFSTSHLNYSLNDFDMRLFSSVHVLLLHVPLISQGLFLTFDLPMRS
jgi:hypothetical protein